ncbi:MAG: trypsin-like peptidase domain-containing protein [Candidatus Cloacimonadota bacterium]|nr:trypsin-like peptidase domain-containing protein [Candidatus Cloacimonadota bacterium]
MNSTLRNIILIIILIVLVAYLLNDGKFFNYNKSQSESVAETVLKAENSPSLLPLQDATPKAKKNILLNSNRQNSITDAIGRIQSAVVSVNVVKTQLVRASYPGLYFFDNFFRGFNSQIRKREVQNLGSGVIVSKDGYIITNNHVVEGASKIKIILPDGQEYDAELVGSDAVNDIALLKIENPTRDLPFVELGDSDDIIIGEWTIAMGNPFGFIIKDAQPTVTVGVISAANRNFHQDNKVYKKMIQTDAAINPGNSGGPLFNINGKVIGINTFIFTNSGGSLGIGFAIPINRVKKIVAEIKKFGKIRPIWFGFRVQDISTALANRLGLKTTAGVIVTNIEKGGPANQSGLKEGDIIISINNQKIENTSNAEMAVADINVGEKIVLTVIENGKQKTIIINAKEYKNRRGSFFKL